MLSPPGHQIPSCVLQTGRSGVYTNGGNDEACGEMIPLPATGNSRESEVVAVNGLNGLNGRIVAGAAGAVLLLAS